MAPLAPGDTVLGYVSVPKAQRAAAIRAIRDACAHAGWSLADVVCRRANGNGNGRKDPALTAVLERIAAGEAAGLVIGHDGHHHHSNGGRTELDVASVAGPEFALHRLGDDPGACDVALITLHGRRSSGGRAVD
jgi:hypothetical protein